MSTYENAPATSMIATQCAVCARPLLDAKSVEIGMGPTCRERHGYDDEVAHLPESQRLLANAIVHDIAARQHDDSVRAAGCATLRVLGFARLAERILFRGKSAPAARVLTLRVSSRGTGWYLSAPYNPAATVALRGIPGRRWDADRKENFIPSSGRAALWAMLREHYAGCTLDCPSGALTITPKPVQAELAA